MTLKSDAKFEEKLICCFRNNKNLVNFDPSTQSLNNLHFDWFLLCKVYNVWPKKFRGSFMKLKTNAKFEEKLNCGSENDMRNLSNFHQSTRKSQNWDFDGNLLFKVENIWVKNLQMSYMTLKNDGKLEEELTCRSKLVWGIWQILTRTLESLKNLHFNGLLVTKVFNVWAKKVQRSYVS